MNGARYIQVAERMGWLIAKKLFFVEAGNEGMSG